MLSEAEIRQWLVGLEASLQADKSEVRALIQQGYLSTPGTMSVARLHGLTHLIIAQRQEVLVLKRVLGEVQT